MTTVALDSPLWFRSPDRRFRPAAFWFWHHLPTETEIAERLAEIAFSGLGTIMIQARLALPLPLYLSPDYLSAVRFASAEARRLGIGVEIYDEYQWMSGHGGGHTVAGADHLRERHLFWASASLGADGHATLDIAEIRSPFLEFLGKDGLDWCYEGGVPLFDEWQIVAAVAETDGGTQNLGATTRLLSSEGTGCRIGVDAAGGGGQRVTVFVSARCRTSRMINYLLPEATERFAEIAYAPLLAASGGTADGIFFDHPYAGFYVWKGLEGDFGNSLLWDAALPDLLPSEPLGLQLLALTKDVGPRTSSLRVRFLEAYSTQLHEAFFGTLRRWCDRHGLAFSGHELLTHVGGWTLHDGLGGIDPRAMPGTDYFGVDAYRSETSVDAADYAPQISARFGDSVARAHGRSRCTVEQYSTGRETGMPGAAGQWGLTLGRLRAQAIRHTLFGARRILLHALYLGDGFAPGTASGPNPRFDFAPGFNFQPWWQDVPLVFDEIARLSAFLEDGEPIRPVALLYPLETIRAEAMAPDCGRHFGWWAKALSEAGIGFDIVSEDAVAAAAVEDGELRLPAGRYTTLILPAVTTLAGPGTARPLARFAAAGGRILASGPLPHQSKSAGEDSELSTLLRASVENGDHLPGATEADVVAMVGTLPLGPLRFEGDGPHWAAAARCGDTIRLATVNDSDDWRDLAIPLSACSRIVRWDATTGTRLVLAETDSVLRLSLAPGALLCLEISPCPAARKTDALPPGGGLVAVELPGVLELADGWQFRTDGRPFQAIDTRRGWEAQGHERFAGTGHYRRTIDVPPCQAGYVWHLVLPGLRDTVVCDVDGVVVGRSVAGEAAFALEEGKVTVGLTIRNTAANRYYAGTEFEAAAHQPSGLVSPPLLEVRPCGSSDLRLLET